MSTKQTIQERQVATQERLAQLQLDQQEGGAASGYDDKGNYKVADTDKHLVHVKLTRSVHIPSEERYEYPAIVQTFHPIEYEQMVKNAQFVGFREQEIIHDGRKAEQKKATEGPTDSEIVTLQQEVANKQGLNKVPAMSAEDAKAELNKLPDNVKNAQTETVKAYAFEQPEKKEKK